jgi:hypothetical protein
MSPYRTNAATIRAETLEQLFAPRSNLKAEDGLGLSYRLLPWKRHVFVVTYEPPSLAGFLVELDARTPVSVEVLSSETLTSGRYEVSGDSIGWATYDSWRDQRSIDELAAVAGARVTALDTRFGLGGGKLHFEVSGYDADELPARFRARYPWEALGLPPLTNRDWRVLDRAP